MSFKLLSLIGVCAGLVLSGCSGGDETPATAIPVPSAAKAAEASTPAVPAPAPAKDRGQTVFKKCQVCHTLKDGERHKVGPNLYAVMGATAAQKEGFNYSKAMIASGITWTDENLEAYFERPSQFMPGNQMTFIGLRKPEDRAAVIAYLRSETAP